MERFLTPDRVWGNGPRRLHVYLLPEADDAEVHALAEACREAMAPFPFIAPIPAQWLHVTVQPIKGYPTDAIAPQQREGLVRRLTDAVADVPPFTLTVGSPLVGGFGVHADVDGDLPGEPFAEVYARVRAVVEAVLGPQALVFGPQAPMAGTPLPHMSLGYAAASGDSDEVAWALWKVRPSHAPMRVRAVHLLDVVQDPECSEYRWTPVARIPLGGDLDG